MHAPVRVLVRGVNHLDARHVAAQVHHDQVRGVEELVAVVAVHDVESDVALLKVHAEAVLNPLGPHAHDDGGRHPLQDLVRGRLVRDALRSEKLAHRVELAQVDFDLVGRERAFNRARLGQTGRRGLQLRRDRRGRAAQHMSRRSKARNAEQRSAGRRLKPPRGCLCRRRQQRIVLHPHANGLCAQAPLTHKPWAARRRPRSRLCAPSRWSSYSSRQRAASSAGDCASRTTGERAACVQRPSRRSGFAVRTSSNAM